MLLSDVQQVAALSAAVRPKSGQPELAIPCLQNPLRVSSTGDTSVRGVTRGGHWRVWNLVSGPINAYGVLLEAIENLRTSAGPEDHRGGAASGAETDALVRGTCHQPCFRQLLILNLPPWRKGPRHAGAAQADPPDEELQPGRAWARIVRARPHVTDECRPVPCLRKLAPARVSYSPPVDQQEG
jgi:hypothetical protein